jgi:regulatory protein
MTLTAFDRAAKLLERRPHFRRELERKLARAGFAADEIAAAVERLSALGHLDDLAQAKLHAATLAGRKRFGAARVRAELLRRGAPDEAIDAALGDRDPEAELARARDAARRWVARARAGDGRGGPALARHLDRKGFERRVIFTVLRELAPDGEGESFAEE